MQKPYFAYKNYLREGFFILGKKVVKLQRQTITVQQMQESFIYWKQAQGLSPTTISDYRGHVARFLKRFPEALNNEDSLKSAIFAYMAQQMKPATYNLRLTYLKVFFQWCVQEGYVVENPLIGFKKRKAEGKNVNISIDILQKLINLPDRKTFSGLRDYTLILLTLDCGIRPKEAFGLETTDINVTSLEIYIRSDTAKTRVSRTLPISAVTATSIKELISVHHPIWDKSVKVFCSVDGRPMNRQSWGLRMKKYSDILEHKITPYFLRHVFALQFLRNGGHALALQRTLGHSDLTMTKRYISLTQTDLREQHALASPLNNLLPKKNRVRNL